MKNIFWIIISLGLHAVLVGTFWFSSQNTAVPILTEVIDLTLSAPGTPTPKFSSTTLTPAAPKLLKATDPLPQKINAEIKNPENTAAVSESTSESAGVAVAAQGSENNDSNASVTLGDVTRFPKVSKEVKATYPEEAKQARIDGNVILDVTIDRTGKVREVRLVQGPGFGLNEAAIDALKKFEFTPAQKGSETVAVKIMYTYRFKLGVN